MTGEEERELQEAYRRLNKLETERDERIEALETRLVELQARNDAGEHERARIALLIGASITVEDLPAAVEQAIEGLQSEIARLGEVAIERGRILDRVRNAVAEITRHLP